MHPSIRAHQLIARAIAGTLQGAGVPVPAAQWTAWAYADPDPETLYAADPGVRSNEYIARMAMCLAAHRKQCALDAMDAAIAADPTNADLRHLRASVYVEAARWG